MTTRTLLPARVSATVGALALAACCAGCGDADQYPARADDLGLESAGAGGALPLDAELGGSGGESDGPGLEGESAEGSALCTDGAQRKCKVMLPETNGVSNCFVGVNICRDGEWGRCVSAPDPAAGGSDGDADPEGNASQD
jgi:hypothetical protein